MPNREEIIQNRVNAAVAQEKTRMQDIRAAVGRAHTALPRLEADYADQAIASGKSVEQVKGDLLALMTAPNGRELSRANVLAQIASMPGGGKAAPESDAGRSQASMRAELVKQGITPAR